MSHPEADDRAYLIDILERIQRIETFSQSGRAAFFASKLIQDAVIRNFEVIGEATKQLSPNFKQRYPDVPWRQVAGFRDVLIHNYTGVRLSTVWAAIVTSLPPLKARLIEILQELDASS